MKTWIIACTVCLVALLYPGADLQCWDTGGNRGGSWSGISCDGNVQSGNWTGYVTSDCRFFGTGDWESVTGKINPTTKILTATGRSIHGCGPITINGTFSSDFLSVTGSYNYSQGGKGSFVGKIQPE